MLDMLAATLLAVAAGPEFGGQLLLFWVVEG